MQPDNNRILTFAGEPDHCLHRRQQRLRLRPVRVPEAPVGQRRPDAGHQVPEGGAAAAQPGRVLGQAEEPLLLRCR